MNKSFGCWCLIFLASCQTSHISERNLQYSLDETYLLENYQYLASDYLSGRKVGTDANRLAQQHLIERLKQLDITPFHGNYRHPFTIASTFNEEILASNIVGEIRSGQPTDSYIVLTAHFDHLGKQGRRIYNGADDNASGTAAVLAIGKKLAENSHNLHHNFLLIFTDGEESNLKGSKAFVQQNPNLLPHIKLNVNLDMLAGSHNSKELHYLTNRLDLLLNSDEKQRFVAQQHYRDFKVIKGFRRHSETANLRGSWIKASDHYPFYRSDIPFIYYGVGVHKNYHTENDTVENSNTQLLIKSANTIYHQLILLDQLM